MTSGEKLASFFLISSQEDIRVARKGAKKKKRKLCMQNEMKLMHEFFEHFFVAVQHNFFSISSVVALLLLAMTSLCNCLQFEIQIYIESRKINCSKA